MKNIKLSKGAKAGIKGWLEGSDDYRNLECPFVAMSVEAEVLISACDSICLALFPKLKKTRESLSSDWCPCHVYTTAHVERVARRLLK